LKYKVAAEEHNKKIQQPPPPEHISEYWSSFTTDYKSISNR
jgi:hypothetical protein